MCISMYICTSMYMHLFACVVELAIFGMLINLQRVRGLQRSQRTFTEDLEGHACPSLNPKP